MKSLAVIMTVHNRKNKTIQCLDSLSKVNNIPDYDVFMCDDASTDGTVEAVQEKYPKTIIVKGNGSCYWTRGMFLAMKEASKGDYSLYLMVNDDVLFSNEMWNIMDETLNNRKNVGVTGATRSAITGNLTYSGAEFYHSDGRSYVGTKIPPNGKNNNVCDVSNWNCFLISKDIITSVGLIDPVYEHSFGDFDYTLRMKSCGMKVVVSCDYIGVCESNSIAGTYRDGKIPGRERIKKIFSPTGLPFKSWSTFVKRYYKTNIIKNLYGPYIKLIISIILKRDC